MINKANAFQIKVTDFETAVHFAAKFNGAFEKTDNGFIVYWMPK